MNGLPLEGAAASVPRAVDMLEEVPTCGLDDRVGDARQVVEKAGADRCVVVNEAGVVAGALRSKQLDGDPEARAEDVMRPAPSTYRPGVAVDELNHWLADQDKDSALITDSDGRLVGLFRTPLARPPGPLRDSGPHRA